jgi:GNAT superfamily N-acetyltransferase
VASEGQLRDVALWPNWDLPDPPPGHPFTLIRHDGFCIGVFSGTAHVTVYVKSLPDDIDRVVSEVRAKVVATGAQTGAWMIPEAAEPAGLRDALIADYGMTPFDELPHEPRFAALLLTSAPPGHESPGLEARPAESLEEFEAASAVAMESFEVGEQDRQAHDAQRRLLWDFEAAGDSDYRTFVGLLDGEIVGAAALIFGASAAYLVGGSTRSDARGRGVYRALCRARWDAAVARGTPALTVSAGRMSRPILEKLGFASVGWIDVLRDDVAPPTGS